MPLGVAFCRYSCASHLSRRFRRSPRIGTLRFFPRCHFQFYSPMIAFPEIMAVWGWAWFWSYEKCILRHPLQAIKTFSLGETLNLCPAYFRATQLFCSGFGNPGSFVPRYGYKRLPSYLVHVSGSDGLTAYEKAPTEHTQLFLIVPSVILFEKAFI